MDLIGESVLLSIGIVMKMLLHRLTSMTPMSDFRSSSSTTAITVRCCLGVFSYNVLHGEGLILMLVTKPCCLLKDTGSFYSNMLKIKRELKIKPRCNERQTKYGPLCTCFRMQSFVNDAPCTEHVIATPWLVSI